MKISKPFATAQIKRLSVQPYFRGDSCAVMELVSALASISESEDHARQIVDECLTLTDEDGRPLAPAPQDIRRIGYATRRTELRPRPDCRHCSGAGWLFVERRRVWNGRESVVSGATRCACWTPAPKVASVQPIDGRALASDPDLSRVVAGSRGMR